MSPSKLAKANIARSYYDEMSESLLERYEQVTFPEIHEDLVKLALERSGWALDVGCGSGRDAAWLAEKNWRVVAIDPSFPLLRGAQRLHRSPRITWLQDGLPALSKVKQLSTKFDLILLSAVLMHVPAPKQPQAITAMVELLAPKGFLNITVRVGEAKEYRGFYAIDIDKLIHRLSTLSLSLVSSKMDSDRLGRPDVNWRKLNFQRDS
jgi:2-polyprenyl-3-methyl-5-hydroxy-6-metoxy-1,4-benzoquinol methylase